MTLVERFMSKVEMIPFHECWEWTAYVDRAGYGRLRVAGDALLAHRLSYLLFVGEVPKVVCVLHACDNRPCVNPKHLFLGSRQDNNLDRDLKGRNAWKLTWANVREMRQLRASGWKLRALSERFKVNMAMVSRICIQKAWKER